MTRIDPAMSASDQLRRIIGRAAHLLPAQGPITVFIHHNTLHAFEHLTFDEAVLRGAETFGCEPYMSEDRYRSEMHQGRIIEDDLVAVLHDELGPRAADSILGLTTRRDLRSTMLERPHWSGTDAELAYHLAETTALTRMRSDLAPESRIRLIAETRRWAMRDLRGSGQNRPPWAWELFHRFGERQMESWSDLRWEEFAVFGLWNVCREAIARRPAPARSARIPVRHREFLLARAGVDADLPVNDLLVRFSAAFLDRGVSNWTMPNRDGGYYRAFLNIYSQPFHAIDKSLIDVPAEVAKLIALKVEPFDCIRESLEILGVQPEGWEDYISATLLALRGWAGMIHQMEIRGDRVAHPIPHGSLEEFLAVRLILDRCAVGRLARDEAGFDLPLDRYRETVREQLPIGSGSSVDRRTFPIFQLAQLMAWAPGELDRLTEADWDVLVGEIESFDGIARRRVFHLAYERRFRIRSLDALSLHAGHGRPAAARPRFQVVTCLDEREESFRRHLEEVAPDAETFGAAGFFNVAMYYRGAADAYFVPLCPIALTPGHWVEERVPDAQAKSYERQRKTRRLLGTASRQFQNGTRSFLVGAVLSAGLGVLATVPLVVRVLFPRLAGRVRGLFGRYVRTPVATQLNLERSGAEPGPDDGSRGFSVEEMAAAAGRLLRDIGLVENFGPLVIILGHGSNSLNNPHTSAYDCGACGGSPGAPNGRALAQMLNDPRVRERIAASGIQVPDDTQFVGGYHNTCDDSVSFADTDRIPESHRELLARARVDFARACERNAHERSRRFLSAPLDRVPSEARRHVENRSEDLAQVRPELGHATNALCIVGRRGRTRGLFLDRRAFLTSYDPTQDDAVGSTLGRLLGAAVPVCAGINLEYYFSHVDPQGYGCGTKLPHNIAALVGVMDGAASDLRTGLPWQMVEIHEPVRLLFVVETTAETLLAVMGHNAMVDRMIRNSWIQMAILDPQSNAIRVFRDGEFVPYQPGVSVLPRAATSVDWYRGRRDHLEFAELTGGA